jgi:hypothetical protein
LAAVFFSADYSIAIAINKKREYAAFIGFVGARYRANYYELARVMRVRFFGFFAGVFINRARPVPGRMAAPAVNAFFCAA